jgi:hypothetical protein
MGSSLKRWFTNRGPRPDPDCVQAGLKQIFKRYQPCRFQRTNIACHSPYFILTYRSKICRYYLIVLHAKIRQKGYLLIMSYITRVIEFVFTLTTYLDFYLLPLNHKVSHIRFVFSFHVSLKFELRGTCLVNFF